MVNKNWIKSAIKNPGALKEKVGSKGLTKKGTIKTSALNKASKSSNPTTRKQANLAKTLKKINKGK